MRFMQILYLIISLVLSFILNINLVANAESSLDNELPQCVVMSHCIRVNFSVDNIEEAFKNATLVVESTPRTKIVERKKFYIHAEAKTKWRRYTDDLLIQALPKKGVIQVRSESRVGIGGNGVNRKRVEDFAKRLKSF